MPPVPSCKSFLQSDTSPMTFTTDNIQILFLSDQLRQRLVRMSVRHHEQLFSHQQREQQLLVALQECATALEKSVQVITQMSGGNPAAVPTEIVQVAMKYSTKNSGGADQLTIMSS